MDTVDNLIQTVRREVSEYVRPSPNATAYYVENGEQHVFAVLSVPTSDPQRTSVVIMARLVDDFVVFESDKTNKPFYEAILQPGNSRQQIVLFFQRHPISALLT